IPLGNSGQTIGRNLCCRPVDNSPVNPQAGNDGCRRTIDGQDALFGLINFAVTISIPFNRQLTLVRTGRCDSLVQELARRI
ncbi:hypothetical protein NY486_04605, partial [Enterobacter hormaechei]|nr:hypothetical protein [Enterobacter hormaechei]